MIIAPYGYYTTLEGKWIERERCNIFERMLIWQGKCGSINVGVCVLGAIIEGIRK